MGGVIIILFIIVIVAYKSIRIVNQSEVFIGERLGRYHKTATSGLNLINPFLDKIRAKIDLREQIMDVPPQNVITKDNVTIRIDTVVFYQITEPQRAVYEIQKVRKYRTKGL